MTPVAVLFDRGNLFADDWKIKVDFEKFSL